MTPHSVLCVLPPYVLEHVAEHGPEELRGRARATLDHDRAVRSQRQAHASAIAEPAPTARAGGGAPQRTIYDAHHLESQLDQATVVRREGASKVADTAVDEAYDGLGATYELYWQAYQRDSIDGRGLPLHAYVHYAQDYDNAFWDGKEMIFGDGDGRLFVRFTGSIDVIGHELTHGVTANEANLAYQGQSGALNESISDVFGSLVKQHALGQTAAEGDWLIGAGILAPGIHGKALRSMSHPGTAYDDPMLGKDPQPADMAHYVETTSDEGGVHTNSGIPNRAFYLAATAIGGRAWERAGRIWYETLRSRDLQATASFSDFAALTVRTAGSLFAENGAEQRAVAKAWETVGVTSTPAAVG